jgi:hypothetical protein
VDEGVLQTFWIDGDGDGHGSDATDAMTMTACFAPDGFVDNNDDCDDATMSIHPGALEICDLGDVDEDCDGVANPSTLCTCVAPMSRSCAAMGACAGGTQDCSAVTGAWSDCSIAPVGETCNMIDDDCDGTVDNGVTLTCYADLDNDTFAASTATAIEKCPVAGRIPFGGCPTGFTDRTPFGADADCADDDRDRNPNAVEVCNGVDDDCDSMTDEGVSITCYADADNDTYALPSASAARKCPVSGRGSVGGCPPMFTNRLPTDAADCDDDPATGSAINPAATEICDPAPFVDEDCDGLANPPADCDCAPPATRACSDPGVCMAGTESCQVDGTWGACSITPAPVEACDGMDDDCDGAVDEIYDCIQGSAPIVGCMTSCGTSGQQECLGTCAQDICRAAEICNGCDDDSDGTVDDDPSFLCALGDTDVMCTNSCGVVGVGDCSSDCMGFAPGSCAATEVCNYCDDDGDGTTQDERGLASTDLNYNINCGELRLVSALGCAARTTFPFPEEAHLVSRGSFNDRGAAWITRSLGMGWGALDVFAIARVRNPTDGTKAADGWAIILADGGTGDVGPVGGALGVPFGRTGLAIEWRYYTNNPNVDQPDTITVRRLTGAAPGQVIYGPVAVPATFTHLNWSTSEVQQTMEVIYTPDDPMTSSRTEERLTVRDATGNVFTLSDQAPLTVMNKLRDELTSGVPIEVGFTAAGGGRRTDTWIVGSATMSVGSRVTAQNICF